MGPENANQPLDVHAVIMVMVDQMASIAWQKMGLQPDALTGQIHKDMAQAKTAVDVVANLSEFISPQLDDTDQRELGKLVSNLKINFVQKSAEGGS